MTAVLILVQLFLALVFLAHGLMLLNPPPEIAEQMNASLPRWFQLFLGVAEVAAAAGLTLPGLARIQPRLVPLAAMGLMVVMVSATAWHLLRQEWSSAVMTLVLLCLATSIAYMRWYVRPIAPRQSAPPGTAAPRVKPAPESRGSSRYS